MSITYKIEMYRRVDGDGYLALFWTNGSRHSLYATGATEEEVREKIDRHHRDALASIERQDASVRARREKAAKAKAQKEAAE
jgi:hypothetical protein